MASTQKDNFRKEDTSGNDGFFSYFKRDKRQRIDSGEERGRNNVIHQKLNKKGSDLSELKGMKSDMEEILTALDTPLEVNGIRTDLQKMFEFVEGVRSSLINMEERLLQQEKKIEGMNTKIEAQSNLIDNLRGDLHKTQATVVDAESHVQWSKAEIVKAHKKIQKLDDKTIDLCARGRRSNLIFHGISEEGDQENCMAKVKDFIKVKCKVQDDVVIEVAHRLGAKKATNIGTRGNKPRPMLARFLNKGDRNMIKKTKRDLPKDAGIGITEDFPYEIRMGRNELIPLMIQAKMDGKEAWIAYPCRLFIDRKLFKELDPKDFA